MTKALGFTQEEVKRAIKGAKAAGMRVVGVRLRDGVLLVEDGDNPPALVPHPPAGAQGEVDWDDVQA